MLSYKEHDTTSRTGKLVMGILALIAKFENDIRRERQMDGIKKASAEPVSVASLFGGRDHPASKEAEEGR